MPRRAPWPPDSWGDPPFFAVRRLGHVNLIVDDIDRSVAFYREVVGLGVAWRRSNMRTGFHSNGNSHHDIGPIDLHGPLGAGARPALNHFAFELETQVDLVEGYQRAPAAGLAFTAMYDHEISHSLYYDDLEGRQIEVYADTDVDWQHRLVNPIKPSLRRCGRRRRGAGRAAGGRGSHRRASRRSSGPGR